LYCFSDRNEYLSKILNFFDTILLFNFVLGLKMNLNGFFTYVLFELLKRVLELNEDPLEISLISLES
jgi:hypothetical protein